MMGLFSSIFGSPSKEQIDQQIYNKQLQLGALKANLAAMTPKQKKEQPFNVANIKSAIEKTKADIDLLKAQRRNAK